MIKQYTTKEMVIELLDNPHKKFKRYNDEVFKVYMTTRGYIEQKVHDFTMPIPLGLYKSELWLEDTEECEK